MLEYVAAIGGAACFWYAGWRWGQDRKLVDVHLRMDQSLFTRPMREEELAHVIAGVSMKDEVVVTDHGGDEVFRIHVMPHRAGGVREQGGTGL